MPIKKKPRPSASPKSPSLVFNTIAVVIVRVYPAMLPPTIKTAPTSEIVRPKPANTAVVTGRLAMARSIRIDRSRVAPSARRAPPYSCQGSSTARCANAVMIGAANIACAKTIALGVNSSASAPRGPERERAR